MCGILGFFEDHGRDRALKLETMSRRIAQRGPDDFGKWICPDTGIALAHRRLSILDLSPLGHQPMFSPSERYVTVFNGEIYNFKALQRELLGAGFVFKGGSDTEVLLAAIEHWGVRGSVERFVGMFAFAIWDRTDRTLWLVRDRVGKKPLYYGWNRGVFYFCSEVKPLRAHPRFVPEIDRRALSLMLRYGYVPAPLSIYRGILKLPPGSLLSLSQQDLAAESGHPHPRPESYWDAERLAIAAKDLSPLLSEESAYGEFKRLLEDSVGLRMLADVPVGAFLSGGIDSSLVVAMMQRLGGVPARTFTIGFHEKRFNEAPYAARIARHLKTQHTEVYLSSAEARDVIPRMAMVFDEPFGDQSQIPTYLVSQVARQAVTVALSGDGGDEIFAGYPRYWKTDALWKLIRPFPPQIRRIAGCAVRTMPESFWKIFFSLMAKVAPDYFSEKDVAAKIDRISHVLELENFEQLYQRVLSFHEHDLCVVRGTEPLGLDTVQPGLDGRDLLSRIERLMLIDLKSYLPDDILVKVDRCSMAVSLEARAPLLDHRIIELAWRIPLSLKMRDRSSKFLLRELLATMVPRELFERPKMGFGIPYGEWMRTDLKDWCAELLAPRELQEHGLLVNETVERLWHDFVRGRDSYGTLIWNIVLFQNWYKHQTHA